MILVGKVRKSGKSEKSESLEIPKVEKVRKFREEEGKYTKNSSFILPNHLTGTTMPVKNYRLTCLMSVCLLLISRPGFAQYQYPFQNPDVPTEQRISNLLSLMTL